MKLFIKISLLLLLIAFVKAQHSNKHVDNLRMVPGNAANDTIRRYDIVKAQGGELKVETKEGEGSVFIIQGIV